MPSSRAFPWNRISLAMIAIGVLLAASSVMRKSVTVDEFQALPSGIAVWQTGDFRYPYGTPPLSQLIPALPAFLAGARVEPVEGRYANWGVAHAFADSHPGEFHTYFLMARLVSCAVFLGLLVLVYLFSRDLYGESGAALAVFCAVFNPNLLAHGPLVTPDIYLAAAMLGFLYVLDRYRRAPSLGGAAATGAALGLCALTKFTGLLLFPALPLLLFLAQVREKSVWRHIGTAWLTGFGLIHLTYLFQGSLAPAGSYFFQSGFFQALFRPLPAWLPVPLPAAFLHAIDGQLSEPPYLAYLLGSFNERGFFSYYLVALLVKTPVAILVLAIAAYFLKRLEARERPLVFLVVFYLCFFSVARHKNIGLRYLLFLYPMLAVWSGRLAGLVVHEKHRVVLAGLCASLAIGTLGSWPHYLAYFNLPSGGSSFGHHYLIDSNLDWGQDLTGLKDFMLERGIEEVDLAHFGHVSPALYGIKFHKFDPFSSARRPYLAVSANFLFGRPFFQNGLPEIPSSMEYFSRLRDRKPVAIIGHSIFVYEAQPAQP